MTIDKKITQTCNMCGESRNLSVNRIDSRAAFKGGWREISDNKHLCPACIDKIGKD